MIQRLSKFDLLTRWGAFAPAWLIELAVAFCAVAVAMIVRASLEQVTPGILVFALMYPATMIASLLAGWRAGAVTILVGGALTWYLIMPPQMSFALRSRADTLNLFLYVASAGLIVFLAGAFRISALTAVKESERQLKERQRLLDALRESDSRRELATAAGRVGIWEWRLDTNEMIYTREAKLIYGFSPDEEITFDKIRALNHPEDAPRVLAQAERARDPAVRDESPYEYRIITPAGELRWLYASGKAVFEERDGEVVATRYVGTLLDITRRRRSEDELTASEARLRLAVEAGRMAVWEADGRTGSITNSPELNRLLGLPDDATPTLEEVNSRYMPGELERVRGLVVAALARGERFVEAEYRYRWPSGDVRWLLIRSELQLDATGTPQKATGVLMDITERKRAEDRLRLLAREVDHRANNLMAVVQGVVELSRAADAERLKDVIVGRVNALARAHQLLSEARWEGADLARLAREEILPFTIGNPERVVLEGPTVALAPAAAQGVAMALHELTTNAAKYGALSTPEGRVRIGWSLTPDDRLRLEWRESGGPPVTPPTQRGLGATILKRALEGPIRGSTRLDWRAEGLVAELDLPLDPDAGPAVSPT